MFNDVEFRKSLLISVATSVLVILLVDPVLKLMLKWIMWLGTNASESWTNGIYLSAALDADQKFSFFIMAFGVASAQGALTGSVLARFRSRAEAPAKQVFNKGRSLRVASLVLLPLTWLFGMSILASSFAELQLNTSFKQRLTVLAAKASDQEIKELRAAWALMEKQSDYKAINTTMQRMAERLNTKLPPALW